MSFTMFISCYDAHGRQRRYLLTNLHSVSRMIYLDPAIHTTNAFHLPKFMVSTFEIPGTFIGDIDRGGSCNVAIQRFCPHGITHIESSAHITSKSEDPITIKDLPVNNLQGLVLLIDLSRETPLLINKLIDVSLIKEKLEKNILPINMLAIKTHSSLNNANYDFSGKDFVALSPAAAEYIYSYSSNNNQPILTLLLDLPSADPEKDGGKLAAHRAFFGLDRQSSSRKGPDSRALIELAHFSDLREGYYYCICTPLKIQTDAVATDILFGELLEQSETRTL